MKCMYRICTLNFNEMNVQFILEQNKCPVQAFVKLIDNNFYRVTVTRNASIMSSN